METNRTLKVFLCHASQDKPVARELYRKLESEGWVDPWLDTENLLPGQDWNLEIQKAVESSDVVIVFLSQSSVNKEGYIQRELKFVLDITDEKPEGTIFIIPVRLDSKTEPPRRLRSIQWVDWFGKNSYQTIVRALKIRNNSIAVLEHDAVQYNLDVVNDFLLKLSDKQLKSLVYEELPNLFESINWGGYMFKNVSEIILFAQRENKISNMVEWLSKNSPSLYLKYSSKLELVSSARGDGGNIVISGGETIINVRGVEKNRFRNPYVTGNPIQPTNSRVFWGRLDIAEAIVHEIKRSRQKPSFLLYGRRRMGKTSALLNLRRLIRDIKIIDILISGQNSKFRTDVDFCFYVTDKIIKATKEGLLLADNFIQQQKYADYAYFKNQPSLALSVFFDEYHEFLEKNDLYCLLMLDEYEEFGNLSRELLLQLRDTLQHMTRFIFIFSGISRINELSNPYWSEVFINVRTLKISFLNHNDGYKLLTEPAPELGYESQELIERILDITGGQPFLLQVIAAEMVNVLNLSNKLAVTNEDLELVIPKIFSIWQNYFDSYIWQKECSSEIHKLIVKRVAKKKRIAQSDFDNYSIQVKDLVEKDILKIQNGSLELAMPIIGMWLEHTNQL